MRVWIPMTILALGVTAACGRDADPGTADDEEVQVDEELGTLRVLNQVNEPVAIYLEGQELYAVPPGTAYTFRNLPTRQVGIYGVGRISQKHFDLPRLTIAPGGEYEWTIQD